jgi:homoserine dehydrogenase
MKHYKLALLGFGSVGQALAHLLLEKQAELEQRYGIGFSVTGIATGHHGSAIDLTGIDLRYAISLLKKGTSLEKVNKAPHTADSFEFIRACAADVLFENTPVDYQTGQPAVDHLHLALECGMHAITANKGPVVHAYHELTKLAAAKERKFYFESTVMDGAPLFSLFRSALPGVRLRSLHGVLNSTTNLILTRMESGESLDQATAYAQSIGIAETDPSGDIDGWDAAVKVAALVTVLMDVPLKPAQVDRQGIRDISQEDISCAHQEGKRWKLLCSAYKYGDEIDGYKINARVAPEMIDRESPLYFIDGTTSIVQFESDVLGQLSIIEENPGPHTTAYGLLADFINAVRESSPTQPSL